MQEFKETENFKKYESTMKRLKKPNKPKTQSGGTTTLELRRSLFLLCMFADSNLNCFPLCPHLPGAPQKPASMPSKPPDALKLFKEQAGDSAWMTTDVWTKSTTVRKSKSSPIILSLRARSWSKRPLQKEAEKLIQTTPCLFACSTIKRVATVATMSFRNQTST